MYDRQYQMERFGTNLGNLLRIRKLKKAGKMLGELGGVTEKNINTVVQKYELSAGATKELLSTYQTLEQWKEKNKLEEPMSDAIRIHLNKRTNFEFPEEMSLGQALSILKVLPPDKQKEWDSKFLVNEEGKSQFVSTKPGTVVDPGFTVPGQAGKKETEKLKSVKASLEKALQSYNNIMSGVGVYVPDENKKELARQRKNEVVVHAKNYMANGGTIQDLGYENLELLKLIYTGEDPIDIEPETKSGGILEWLGLGKPKPTVEPDVEKALAGKSPGRYKINGKVYKWNGTQIIQ